MPPNAMVAPTPAPKMGKFAASKMVVFESWAILQKDKEIMWFPILSALFSVLTLILFAILYFIVVLKGDTSALANIFTGDASTVEQYRSGTQPIEYVLLFFYYVVSFLVINFFQAGIFIIANARMHGGDATFMDGVNGALNRFGKLFLWSLISATVGIILRAIEDRFKVVGWIVAALLGAAWQILTYFSLPALVIDDVSVTESFSVSASVIRKMWGEAIIVNVGVGLFFAGLFFLGAIVFIVGLFLAPTTAAHIFLGFVLLIYILGLAVVSSALSSIFNLALYEYARTGQVPMGFSPDLITTAIRKK